METMTLVDYKHYLSTTVHYDDKDHGRRMNLLFEINSILRHEQSQEGEINPVQIGCVTVTVT